MGRDGGREEGSASSLDFLTEGSLTPQLNKSSGCDLTVGGGGWGGHIIALSRLPGLGLRVFTPSCSGCTHASEERRGEGDTAAILKMVNISHIQYLAALNRQVLTLFQSLDLPPSLSPSVSFPASLTHTHTHVRARPYTHTLPACDPQNRGGRSALSCCRIDWQFMSTEGLYVVCMCVCTCACSPYIGAV